MGGEITVSFPKEQRLESPPPVSLDRKEVLERKEATQSENQENKTLDLKKTVSDLEKISLAFNRRLKFIIDLDSKELIVKVIDNETDKVIKVLPPEELQRLHHRIRETMGFLFDRLV